MGQVSEMLRKDSYRLGKEETTTALIIEMLEEGISTETISRVTKKSLHDILAIKEKNNL